MTRDRDDERPDDRFADRSPDPGTDDAAFDPDRRPTSDREQADDPAAGFTWGLRPRAEVHGSADHGPTTPERVPVPVPAPARRMPEPKPEATPEPEGAASIKLAARPFYPPPRVSSSNVGADPGVRAPQSRALASSEAVPQEPAPLTPEPSGWESLFGAGAADSTGPVLPPRGNVATPPAARPAESWIAHSRARQERRFTTRQLLITLLALLVVAVGVLLLFALVQAGARGVGPDVESPQIGTLIPGIG